MKQKDKDNCTRIIHIRDGKIVKGLEVSGLKETDEMSEARLSLQSEYKERCERKILEFIRSEKSQDIFEIRISKIKDSIDQEILTNLPIYFDDLVSELIEKEDIPGKIKSGVLILEKKKNVFEA